MPTQTFTPEEKQQRLEEIRRRLGGTGYNSAGSQSGEFNPQAEITRLRNLATTTKAEKEKQEKTGILSTLVNGLSDIVRQPANFFAKAGSSIGEFAADSALGDKFGKWLAEKSGLTKEEVQAIEESFYKPTVFQPEGKNTRAFKSGQEFIGEAAEAALNLSTPFIGGGAVAKTATTPLLRMGAKELLTKGLATDAVIGGGYRFSKAMQEGKDAGDVAMDTFKGVGEGALFGRGLRIGGHLLGAGARAGNKALRTGASETVDFVKGIPESRFGQKTKQVATGSYQRLKEGLQRPKRLVTRAGEAAERSAERFERVKKATPALKTAIETNVDEPVVNFFLDTDKKTLGLAKEAMDIAESKTKNLTEVRPEIVAGREVENWYKNILTKEQEVGAKIGKEVEKLSTNKTINNQLQVKKLDQILNRLGIKKRGRLLEFQGTSFTPDERNKIKELYQLVTEGKKVISPKEVYDRDRLFGKLQRKSRFDGVGDILVSSEDGTQKSLFNVFRDVYRDTLDELNPEIRKLNREYRSTKTFLEDIENSIIKGGNFETTKGMDAAEFAQTNLRRLTQDSQSSAVYREIVNKMREMNKELGYETADVAGLNEFVQKLRELVPEAVPSTSATSIFSGGISGAVEKAIMAGAPNKQDQLRAIRGLIEELIQTAK